MTAPLSTLRAKRGVLPPPEVLELQLPDWDIENTRELEREAFERDQQMDDDDYERDDRERWRP